MILGNCRRRHCYWRDPQRRQAALQYLHRPRSPTDILAPVTMLKVVNGLEY